MSFRLKLKNALEEGVLLFAKYGLITLLVYMSLNYVTKVYQMAVNGQAAAVAIAEYQAKGWLPKFPVPPNTNVNGAR